MITIKAQCYDKLLFQFSSDFGRIITSCLVNDDHIVKAGMWVENLSVI